jgi:hypothetical protein
MPDRAVGARQQQLHHTGAQGAIARALADPTLENMLASLDAQHKATPPVAVEVLRSLPTDQ